jgi:hypothetical protein
VDAVALRELAVVGSRRRSTNRRMRCGRSFGHTTPLIRTPSYTTRTTSLSGCPASRPTHDMPLSWIRSARSIRATWEMSSKRFSTIECPVDGSGLRPSAPGRTARSTPTARARTTPLGGASRRSASVARGVNSCPSAAWARDGRTPITIAARGIERRIVPPLGTARRPRLRPGSGRLQLIRTTGVSESDVRPQGGPSRPRRLAASARPEPLGTHALESVCRRTLNLVGVNNPSA